MLVVEKYGTEVVFAGFEGFTQVLDYPSFLLLLERGSRITYRGDESQEPHREAELRRNRNSAWHTRSAVVANRTATICSIVCLYPPCILESPEAGVAHFTSRRPMFSCRQLSGTVLFPFNLCHPKNRIFQLAYQTFFPFLLLLFLPAMVFSSPRPE